MRFSFFVGLIGLGIVGGCSSDSEPPSTPSNATTSSSSGSASSSSSSGSSGTSSSSSGSVDTDSGARFVDTCDVKSAECTAAPAGFGEGKGLAEVDRCAFALTESADIAVTSDVVTKLGTIATPTSVADVLNDANHVATKSTTVPGNPSSVQYAFNWEPADNNTEQWIPQGLTGTADADETGKVEGKSAIVVASYDTTVNSSTDQNNGVRLSFVDTTVAISPKYRWVLLVQPKGTKDAPSYDPVKIHAGGLAWYKNWLYVADTTHGFRVFDMRHILKVSTDPGNFGCTASVCRASTYKYVLPQVGKYEVNQTCKPLFSWVALDRTSDPPALVSGEYCSTDACAGPLAGRAFRWPLDTTTGLLRSAVTFPSEVNLMGQKQVQGGTSVKGVFYLSSSAPAADGGDLYRVSKGKAATSQWGDNPEDVMFDPGNTWLWSLNEKAGKRSVFAVKLDAYPPPL